MTVSNQLSAAPAANFEQECGVQPQADNLEAPHTVTSLSFDPEATYDIRHPIVSPESLDAQEEDGADVSRVMQQITHATAALANDAPANISKGELASILEGFAHVLRADPSYTSISLGDHVAEVSQLKALLLEAQETIINLLNDRVYDRAKLAKLEAEVRLLPDLQAQAHRAMNLAQHSDTLQHELLQVRAEVERLRTSYVRAEQGGGWLSRLLRARI